MDGMGYGERVRVMDGESARPLAYSSIMLLTPNGRWQVRTKICLSISAYHPEEWRPAWGIRTIIEAIISFMPSPGEGAPPVRGVGRASDVG